MQEMTTYRVLLSASIAFICFTTVGLCRDSSYDPEQYSRLVRCSEKQDATEWNQWRQTNPTEPINLRNANLTDMRFEQCNLANAGLRGATLNKAQFHGALLTGANLDKACLNETRFGRADLSRASFQDTFGIGPHFKDANLADAGLRNATLEPAYFDGAHFERTDLRHSHMANARMPRVKVFDADLSFANLNGSNLERADIRGSTITDVNLTRANLSYATVTNTDMARTIFGGSNLANAQIGRCNFRETDLRGSDLTETVFVGTDLRGADLRMAMVDGITCFLDCQFDDDTDFRGVGLGNVRISANDKVFLERNIRKKNWEEWYEKDCCLKWPIRFFWWISDYGYSTFRIISCLIASAVAFALVYGIWGRVASPGIISDRCNTDAKPRGTDQRLIRILRPFYFSVVTMTTLGFGDICANPRSIWGHILVTLQVVWGYFLLGAIVTRLGILFTAGGPGL